MNFFDSTNKDGNVVQGYGLASINTGINAFGAWNAYQTLANTRKDSRLNRKLARANYTNQAKSSNMDLDRYTRYRQMLEGNTTQGTNKYMKSEAYKQQRFSEVL